MNIDVIIYRVRLSFLPLQRLIRNETIRNPIINPPVGDRIVPIPLLPPEKTGNPTKPRNV